MCVGGGGLRREAGLAVSADLSPHDDHALDNPRLAVDERGGDLRRALAPVRAHKDSDSRSGPRHTSDVWIVPSESLRYIPVVSPSSALEAARKLGLSKVKVATPVEPSRDLVSFTSGTAGSG